MRTLILLILLLACKHKVLASPDDVRISVSGSVKVWFPEKPLLIDTLGQQVYYYRVGNEMLVCTVAPISAEILSSDTFNMERLLNNFINDIVSGANVLILSDVKYKGLPAKYYKVRVDDELHTLHGLMLDSYTLPVNDTVYSFAYWRFNATELYDYSRQRTFYDKIEILLPAEKEAAENSGSFSEEEYRVPVSPWRWVLVVLLSLLVAGLGFLAYRKYFRQ